MKKPYDAAPVYARMDAATKGLEAVGLVHQGKAVGRIVTKTSPGMSRAWVQVWGAPVVEGRATGYGYDKQSQAVWEACAKLAKLEEAKRPDNAAQVEALCAAVLAPDAHPAGGGWKNRIEAAGFVLARAI